MPKIQHFFKKYSRFNLFCTFIVCINFKWCFYIDIGIYMIEVTERAVHNKFISEFLQKIKECIARRLRDEMEGRVNVEQGDQIWVQSGSDWP